MKISGSTALVAGADRGLGRVLVVADSAPIPGSPQGGGKDAPYSCVGSIPNGSFRKAVDKVRVSQGAPHMRAGP
jgi:hypothetical protein